MFSVACFLSKALCYLPAALIACTQGHPALTYIKGTREFYLCLLSAFILGEALKLTWQLAVTVISFTLLPGPNKMKLHPKHKNVFSTALSVLYHPIMTSNLLNYIVTFMSLMMTLLNELEEFNLA